MRILYQNIYMLEDYLHTIIYYFYMRKNLILGHLKIDNFDNFMYLVNHNIMRYDVLSKNT